jgi:glycerol-3-phosphate acyltransferase PlsY
MVGEVFLVLLVIGVAYLLGSIPSAYLIGRWLKGIDLREAGDGRLGATTAYRRAGFLGGLIVAIMDVGKGVAVVLMVKMLGLPLAVVIIAGLAAVAGHNWSVFLHFKGGKGALTTYAVLVSLMFWQFFAALAVAGIVVLITKKTGFSTGVLFCFLALLNLFTGSGVVLVITPILISVPMVLKHISMQKADVAVMADVEHQREEG